MRLRLTFCFLVAGCAPLPELGSQDEPPGPTPPLLSAAALAELSELTAKSEGADNLNARAAALRRRAADLAHSI